VTYTIDPVQFPIRIDRVDGLFGTQNPQPPITVHWSMLVWAGEPTNGTLVYVITSDGVNPPHMVLTQQVPQPNAIYLQAMVDPSDPEQIIVNNNGSNKFTVGFRIDQMNQVPSSNCNFGCTPAHCCPHPPSTNLFPTTDLDGLQQASNNWIFVPQGCGPCVLGAGWWRFSQLGANTPSGDWIIRAIYTPTTCPAPTGACCLANGACVGEVTATQCTAQSGSFQGPGSQCSTTNCPVPTGACCLGNGNCLADHTQAQCTSAGGTFMGAGSECGVNLCRGACCVPSTQQCVFTTPNNCASVSGTFHGFGSSCQTVACFGACCLPNGSCVGGVSPASCSSQGGVFQGANTTCGGVNCPPPLGACCVGTACLKDVSESDCTIGFGGVWMGAQSACAPNNPCVATPCPADISPQPNGDGVVNVNDLLMVINSWGQCPPAPASCPADISPQPNGDGVVNVNDLLMVINSWGPCPN
jgi:hypothetical protein